MDPMPDTLGDFLRSRRAQLTPERAGLPPGERRRVTGLRREEVAQLAGISPEYYLRLEQGRNRRPSDQILRGLAAALRLDEAAAAYLHRLAHPAPPTGPRPGAGAARPDADLQLLLDAWPTTPAYAQAASGRVVAANRLATALCPFFGVGHDPLRAVFLEPGMRRLYPRWDDVTAKAVSGLRAALALDGTDPGLLAAIDELTTASERFRTLWARREVRRRTVGRTRFQHPDVGALDLHYEKLLRPEARQLLVVYRADPGSPSAERLELLGR
ncbi:helix-turn-helix protein [Kitasatospora sp. SolWspMP-SS2h]|uniref:helix-turn-helix domain-containing protein n=1 Tax=Kitasatospora sp. SolWspMP-SS2h TaxID=1305729 RepID=UPI000DC008CC|nr:helix-turn-helix transcriptional regulator [Kitasatospora sp. SolWspMP-SS2h]RAJ43702.1 helix-turn-helix protein [Kitasatospora sp. SolWspMP-SS2h]